MDIQGGVWRMSRWGVEMSRQDVEVVSSMFEFAV